MAKDQSRMGNGILGDIDPAPEPESPGSGQPVRDESRDPRDRSPEKNDRAMPDPGGRVEDTNRR